MREYMAAGGRAAREAWSGAVGVSTQPQVVGINCDIVRKSRETISTKQCIQRKTVGKKIVMYLEMFVIIVNCNVKNKNYYTFRRHPNLIVKH